MLEEKIKALYDKFKNSTSKFNRVAYVEQTVEYRRGQNNPNSLKLKLRREHFFHVSRRGKVHFHRALKVLHLNMLQLQVDNLINHRAKRARSNLKKSRIW